MHKMFLLEKKIPYSSTLTIAFNKNTTNKTEATTTIQTIVEWKNKMFNSI